MLSSAIKGASRCRIPKTCHCCNNPSGKVKSCQSISKAPQTYKNKNNRKSMNSGGVAILPKRNKNACPLERNYSSVEKLHTSRKKESYFKNELPVYSSDRHQIPILESSMRVPSTKRIKSSTKTEENTVAQIDFFSEHYGGFECIEDLKAASLQYSPNLNDSSKESRNLTFEEIKEIYYKNRSPPVEMMSSVTPNDSSKKQKRGFGPLVREKYPCMQKFMNPALCFQKKCHTVPVTLKYLNTLFDIRQLAEYAKTDIKHLPAPIIKLKRLPDVIYQHYIKNSSESQNKT
ncbi:hypothetical protein NPIL_657771 [Nephila pilipes]|uniref:Uncharacterized protein n=1 Tax=Nephila pilipes TaxID=299642 RepID=A0A8X6NS65_NEPPI|nr:hypothetical protein NPIL_657771 [Nephila pilipes]